MYDGYTWNPQFADTTSLARVTDVRLTHATAFSTVHRVFIAPTTVDFAVNIADPTTRPNNGALVPANGYIVHTGGVENTATARIATTDKALDFATGEPRTAHTYNMTAKSYTCLLYTSPSPRDRQKSRMPSSA